MESSYRYDSVIHCRMYAFEPILDIYDETIRAEGLTHSDIRQGDEIEEISPLLPAEMRTDVPGMERAIVCGDPLLWGEQLDYQQGFDNPYGAFGTCSLVSISNLRTMAGQESTEPEVVAYAMETHQCETPGEGRMGGGTTLRNQLDILEHYSLPAHCEFASDATAERVAQAVEGGYGVLLNLNSGILQDREWKVRDEDGRVGPTHSVCVTGTVRNSETGDLAGFYLCDSSSARSDGSHLFVTLDELDRCYSQVEGCSAIITDEPIRSC